MEKELIKTDNYDVEVFSFTTNKPLYNLVVVHGASEYIQRYEDFALFANQNDINVFGINNLGHGPKRNKEYEGVVFSDRFNETRLVSDINLLVEHIGANSKLPIYILGHSMGSVLTRYYMKNTTQNISGVILSGSVYPNNLLIKLGLRLSKVVCSIKGRNNVSKLLNKLAFGDLNNALSYSQVNIHNYLNDEDCGMPFTNGALYELFNATYEASTTLNLMQKTNYLIIAGCDDPFSHHTKDLIKLEKEMNKDNFKVQSKFYQKMKHEILNEEENIIVYQDVINFIKKGSI